MSVEVKNRYISNEKIDLLKIIEGIHDERSGAIVIFSGEARNHNEGKAVDYLEYEVEINLAEKMIQQILQEATQKWKLHNAYCVHKVGKVGLCESAVVVITTCSHRKEAYAANQYIIDQVKHNVPIWKKEYFSDGTTEWSKGCKHTSHSH